MSRVLEIWTIQGKPVFTHVGGSKKDIYTYYTVG